MQAYIFLAYSIENKISKELDTLFPRYPFSPYPFWHVAVLKGTLVSVDSS